MPLRAVNPTHALFFHLALLVIRAICVIPQVVVKVFLKNADLLLHVNMGEEQSE